MSRGELDSSKKSRRFLRRAGYGDSAYVLAPKARQICSLGRQPQVVDVTELWSPEGATDCGCGVNRSHRFLLVCRRFAAGRFSPVP